MLIEHYFKFQPYLFIIQYSKPFSYFLGIMYGWCIDGVWIVYDQSMNGVLIHVLKSVHTPTLKRMITVVKAHGPDSYRICSLCLSASGGLGMTK